MTSIPLEASFKDARDRLVDVVEIALPDIVNIKPYADTPSLVPPYAEIVIPALTMATIANGKQDITITPEVRLYCGQTLEGYDGELQNTIFFDWLPRISQSFIEHSNLCYPAKPTPIARLDVQRTGFQRAQAIVLPDEGWLLVFYWQLVFITGFKKVIGF